MHSTDRTDLGLTDKNSSCACGTHDEAPAPAAIDAATRQQFNVDGMTCSHCVMSVTEEINGIADVTAVTVDLNVGGSSLVTVSSASPVSADVIRAAIGEAGYSLSESQP